MTRLGSPDSEVEDNTMMHIVRMIRNRHPRPVHLAIAVLLIASALALLAGITRLLY